MKNYLVLIGTSLVLMACVGTQENAAGRHAGMSMGAADASVFQKPIDYIPSALGPYTWSISTDSDLAQRYFKQGLQMRYAFGVNDSARSFREARLADPDCAICYWGEAFALGSFLNGGRLADWTTSAPTTYYWMRLLWNPDLEWEPVVDQMFKRLYGKAAGTAGKLYKLQVQRWEAGGGGISDEGKIKDKPYLMKWPPEVVAQMKTLRDKALAQLADDPAGRQRFLYWTWTFDEFVKEAAARQKGG